jgi:hypothetical protein
VAGWGMLADRCDELGRARSQTINWLHRLLCELVPAGRNSPLPRLLYAHGNAVAENGNLILRPRPLGVLLGPPRCIRPELVVLVDQHLRPGI